MTDRYAVIGHPIAHSKSPYIHREFAQQTLQSLTYERLLAPIDGFIETVEAFRAAGGRGLNVTVPFKEQAFELSTSRSARAEAAGAVNTLGFDENGIYGDNTDGIGLVRDLRANHGIMLHGTRILLIGAGGAARGVVGSLLGERPQRLVIVNRTIAKAHAIVAPFAPAIEVSSFADLAGQQFDVLINATSASMAGELPPIPADVYANASVAYDMMYGAAPTLFQVHAARLGCVHCFDGLGMLVEQAAESFCLWRGVRPATKPVLSLLRAALQV